MPDPTGTQELLGLPLASMSATSRLPLVLLFGGRSAEHDISRITARHVFAAADPERYELTAVGIDRDGTWVRCDVDPSSLGDALDIAGTPVTPFEVLDRNGVVFPLLHGPMGEDGTVQGLLEVADVAYVGCGVLGSAVSMDKIIAKQLADSADIPQAHWRGLHRSEILGPDREVLVDGVVDALGLPLFVKPANMGSSIGVSKASTRDALATALDTALVHDDWVVVEEHIDGREIEVAVLGHTTSPRASVPGEIVAAAEFYDFDDKYTDGAAQLHIPALLDPATTERLRSLACTVFRTFRAEGLSRVDFFYDEGGRGIIFNEINTIPGFTPISMYPQMWQATGLPYRALIDELVNLALERHNEVRRYRGA